MMLPCQMDQYCVGWKQDQCNWQFPDSTPVDVIKYLEEWSLVSGDSQRAYNLTQSAAASEDGTNVTVKGWTSVDGLEGQDWEIYLELDGVLYNTGYKYSKI